MGDTKFRRTRQRTAKGPFRADELIRRTAEGEVRNLAWASLPTADKITSLKARRGQSKRQLNKLESTI